MAEGVALIAFMDEKKKAPLAFSNKFACPICGYSIAELEPRLFSFNNPQGACPDCDGLGMRMFFDVARVVTHPNLSLSGGAIRGWDSNSTFYWAMITALAKHYKFETTKPWQDLPEKVAEPRALRQQRRKDPVQVRQQEEGQPLGVEARVRRHLAEHAAALHGNPEPGRARRAHEVPEHAVV